MSENREKVPTLGNLICTQEMLYRNLPVPNRTVPIHDTRANYLGDNGFYPMTFSLCLMLKKEKQNKCVTYKNHLSKEELHGHRKLNTMAPALSKM